MNRSTDRATGAPPPSTAAIDALFTPCYALLAGDGSGIRFRGTIATAYVPSEDFTTVTAVAA